MRTSRIDRRSPTGDAGDGPASRTEVTERRPAGARRPIVLGHASPALAAFGAAAALVVLAVLGR